MYVVKDLYREKTVIMWLLGGYCAKIEMSLEHNSVKYKLLHHD